MAHGCTVDFLSDLTDMLNELNVKLQGKNKHNQHD